MKKFTNSLFFIALLFCFTTGRAQTIPGSAFPVAGDVLTLIEADTAGVTPGAGGSGVTWNFGSLTNGVGTQLDSFMAPSATPYGAVFPTATLALHEIVFPVTNYYVYYYNNTGSSIYQRIGNVQPDTVIYTTRADEFPYPLTPTTTYSSNYYAHYRTSGGSATEAGVGSVVVDGTGTLTLPTGTYSNVLRSHYTRTENDTTYTPSASAMLQVDNYYEWYQPNSYYPILSIMYSNYSVMGFTAFSKKTVAYRAGYTSSGINDINSSSKNGMLIFPNPTNEQATLVYEMTQAGESQIGIYDLTGRLLQTSVNTSGEGFQTVSLKVSELPVGMYEVRVVNSQSTTSVKLQIVK